VDGSYTGQHFNGTTVPAATGYLTMGLLALVCILVAERGKLFGDGRAHSQAGVSQQAAHKAGSVAKPAAQQSPTFKIGHREQLRLLRKLAHALYIDKTGIGIRTAMCTPWMTDAFGDYPGLSRMILLGVRK
jgi:hypothetical protein